MTTQCERGNLLPPYELLRLEQFLYAPSHRQYSTYHDLCYTSCGAVARMRNSSMVPPWMINLMTHCTMSEHSTTELNPAPNPTNTSYELSTEIIETQRVRGNSLPPLNELLFLICNQGFFYTFHPTDRIIYTIAFLTPIMEHWLKQKIAQWVHHGKWSDDPLHQEQKLYHGR